MALIYARGVTKVHFELNKKKICINFSSARGDVLILFAFQEYILVAKYIHISIKYNLIAQGAALEKRKVPQSILNWVGPSTPSQFKLRQTSPSLNKFFTTKIIQSMILTTDY